MEKIKKKNLNFFSPFHRLNPLTYPLREATIRGADLIHLMPRNFRNSSTYSISGTSRTSSSPAQADACSHPLAAALAFHGGASCCWQQHRPPSLLAVPILWRSLLPQPWTPSTSTSSGRGIRPAPRSIHFSLLWRTPSPSRPWPRPLLLPLASPSLVTAVEQQLPLSLPGSSSPSRCCSLPLSKLTPQPWHSLLLQADDPSSLVQRRGLPPWLAPLMAGPPPRHCRLLLH